MSATINLGRVVGYSAYEVAVQNGFVGTEEQWLASLKGEDGASAVNPFKGWWPDLAALKAAHTATAGDSAYVKDASPATTWSIYVYDSTASSDNYWADSGADADTSNVQTFASGEEVNEVHIVNDLTTGGVDDVLSAEQGKVLLNQSIINTLAVIPTWLTTDGIVNGSDVKNLFDIGNINIGGSAPTYGSSTSRARTKPNVRIPLKKGDVVSFSDYTAVEFYIGWQRKNGSYTSSGAWLHADFTASEDGDYYFTMRVPNSTAAVTVDQFVSLLSFESIVKDDAYYIGHLLVNEVTLNAGSSANAIREKWPTPYIGDVCIEAYCDNSDYIKLLFYDKNNQGISTPWDGDNLIYKPIFLTVPQNCAYITMRIVKKDNTIDTHASAYVSRKGSSRYDAMKNAFNGFVDTCVRMSAVKSVNHRGYNMNKYPENTLEAFKRSKENGFAIVETDVRFTSDGVAVLLHDDTINRTARQWNGSSWVSLSSTINITDITYSDALAYSFGAYKGDEYADEKIARLDDMLKLCKSVGLDVYLELKVNTGLSNIVDIVKSLNMQEHVTYIGSVTNLETIASLDANARLLYVFNLVGMTQEQKNVAISNIAALKTNTNRVGIDVYPYNTNTNPTITNLAISQDDVSACITNGVELEIWTIDLFSAVVDLLDAVPYISGVTSNINIASVSISLSKLKNDAIIL